MITLTPLTFTNLQLQLEGNSWPNDRSTAVAVTPASTSTPGVVQLAATVSITNVNTIHHIVVRSSEPSSEVFRIPVIPFSGASGQLVPINLLLRTSLI